MLIKNYTSYFFFSFFQYLLHTPGILFIVCLFYLISIFVKLVLSLQNLGLIRFVAVSTFSAAVSTFNLCVSVCVYVCESVCVIKNIEKKGNKRKEV